MNLSDPQLTDYGRPTPLKKGDMASLRGGFLRFIRRGDTIIGEIPFNESAAEFHHFMRILAERNNLACDPYNPGQPELPAVKFRTLPTDAFVESS